MFITVYCNAGSCFGSQIFFPNDSKINVFPYRIELYSSNYSFFDNPEMQYNLISLNTVAEFGTCIGINYDNAKVDYDSERRQPFMSKTIKREYMRSVNQRLEREKRHTKLAAVAVEIKLLNSTARRLLESVPVWLPRNHATPPSDRQRCRIRLQLSIMIQKNNQIASCESN